MCVCVCVCVCVCTHTHTHTHTHRYCPEDLPAHPCMRLAYNCEDVLSTKLSRRLITMVKEREPAEGETATCAMTEAVCTGERVEGESDEGITE